MNVLIVEDSTSARKLLRITFEHFGCTVVEAEDGVEGLDMAMRHNPDIIISDALMPRMDGFQLLRAVKDDPALKSIPFIFYSSTYTGEKEVELALSLGAEAFFTKPIEPRELWVKTCAVMEAWESRQRRPAHPMAGESDEQYLREYSMIVATKLEEKVRELEETLALRTLDEDRLQSLNAELTREIAERRQAEKALKEQEQELATIFENAPFIMLLLDGEARIRKVNGMACALAGSSNSDMIDLRSGDAFHCLQASSAPKGCGSGPHCHECVVRLTVLDTFTTGQSHHHVESSLPFSVRQEDQAIPFLLSTTRIMVEEQAMVLLSLQDISEYKKLEAQLFHTQKMESIGTLAGGIAHDFNNILTVIIGYGDVALMDMDLNADHPLRQIIEQMLHAAHRAESLARDLLLFSRKQVGDKNNVDLNETVKSVDNFLRRVIGEDIACEITLTDGKMTVFADAHQLEQVLMNLAINARDAMPGGGTLSITTERLQLDEAFIAAHGFGSTGMYAALTVADSGAGMDEETLRKIFDPFFTTKEIGKGTGLGLAVVYGIIKQHEGHITVNSEPGHGTTFRIYLPLVRTMNMSTNAAVKFDKPHRGTETILLAEDDKAVRDIAQLLLRNFGYEVIVAVDGEDAVLKFQENRGRIQLLLFDVIMPKKNGIVAYDEISALEPGTKVIFASGYATEAVHVKALTDTNVMSISKPYLPSNMLTAVRSMLDKNSNL